MTEEQRIIENKINQMLRLIEILNSDSSNVALKNALIEAVAGLLGVTVTA